MKTKTKLIAAWAESAVNREKMKIKHNIDFFSCEKK